MDRTTLRSLMERAGLKKITQTGDGFACLCPFHANTRSPAFNINADSGLWQCWNPNCGQKGNLVLFLVRLLRMNYDEAVKYAGSVPTLSSSDPSKWHLPEYDKRWARAEGEFMPEAQLGLYARCPVYMLQRGFTKEFLREYDIGFDLQGYEHPKGSRRLMGANRVTFPVRDPHGRLLGCTRRAVNDDFPKYLHDFDKTRTLYLLDRVQPGSVVGVSEGPVDALKARFIAATVGGSGPIFEAMKNMTATLGSSGDDQVSLIAECRPEFVALGFDNDDAGVANTKKWIKMLRARGVGRMQILTFPGSDLGALDIEQVVDVSLEPTFRWLTQH